MLLKPRRIVHRDNYTVILERLKYQTCVGCKYDKNLLCTQIKLRISDGYRLADACGEFDVTSGYYRVEDYKIC